VIIERREFWAMIQPRAIGRRKQRKNEKSLAGGSLLRISGKLPISFLFLCKFLLLLYSFHKLLLLITFLIMDVLCVRKSLPFLRFNGYFPYCYALLRHGD